MDVVIAGGHGKIALHLERLLSDRGDPVRGLVRNPGHREDLAAQGAEAVVVDLEQAPDEAVAGAIDGADAVVFAAGAGPGSGKERKWTMDYGGAAKLLRAARRAGVPRYVIVSSMGADRPPAGEEDTFAVYLQAKAKADEELQASDREWTVVRPGGLTDDPPAGGVTLGEKVPRGRIPRADVAAVLAGCLHRPGTVGKTFEVVSGDTPIDEALDTL